MKESFFFGSDNHQLFGSYYHPTSVDKEVLTVFCPPLFNEFSRTYRAMHKLAVLAAQAGYHVMRFDYSGTGDSFGDLEHVTVKDWLEDIRLAIREGQEISGCRKIQILGVRGGALLACASLEQAHDVVRMLLWDPVFNGADYIVSLQNYHRLTLENNFRLTKAERKDALADVSGWRISEKMREELITFKGELYCKIPKNIMHLINTSPASSIPVQEIKMDLIEYPCNWESDDESLIDPLPVLEHLSKCLSTI